MPGSTSDEIIRGHYGAVVTVVLSTILFFSTTCASGQYSPYRQVNSLNSKLSSELIRTIIQDNKGYLWIGTEEGLNRYDGYTFTVFKNIPGDSTSISDNEIYSLANDANGNVWVGSSNGNISYYNEKRDCFYRLDATANGMPEHAITKLFFDHRGRLWVAVAQNGLYYLDEKTKRFIKAGDLPDIHPGYQANLVYYQNYNSIYDIYEDAHGIFWMATHDGLYTFNPKTNIFQSIRQNAIVPFVDRADLFNDVVPAANGLWLCSWGGGLTFYNQQTGEWKNYKPTKGSVATHNIIQSIEWKNDKQLWLASSDLGLGYFDVEKEKFTFLNTKACQKILIDKTGGLWVTSALEGLLQYDPLTLFLFQKTDVTRTDNGDYYFTNGFYHDVKNRLLYYGVTYGDGLHVYDETTQRESVYPFDLFKSSEKALHVSSIYKDDKDTLWILTNDYIYLFDQSRRSLTKFKQPFDNLPKGDKLLTPDFYRMIRSRNGDLWITTQSNGVYRYNSKEGAFTNYKDGGPNAIVNNRARGIAEDVHGRIWIVNGTTLSIFSYKDNSFRGIDSFIKDLPALHDAKLFDLTSAPNGDIWITSDNGIFQYDHNSDSVQLKHWTSTHEIPSGKLRYIQVDNNGLVWFQTSSTLWCLNPAVKKIVYSTGTKNIFSSACFYIDANNQIYLSAYGGYTSFSPTTAFKKATAPPLAITAFYVNYRKVLIDSLSGPEFRLDHNQNSITIEFSALNFQNSAKNRYSFMLEGFDKDWGTATERHLTNYVNLPPGHYSFKVKASTQEGVWSEPIEIKFQVTPPFWLTWYFISAVVLLLVYIIFLLSKWRAIVIRKDALVKSAFEKKILETEMSTLRAQMNPHFIFNSLNSVNHYILMSDRDTASFYLTKFSKLIRLILENSNKARISLEQELTALKHYIDIELIRFDHSFSYNIDVAPDVDPLTIQFPPLIIQPYVENSIWHGFDRRNRYGVLTISIKKESPAILIITVEDNGVGRGSKKPTLETAGKKSHGLKITEDRLSILSREGYPSSVEIIDLKNDNNEASGTKVIIRITIAELAKQIETIAKH
jgi:ligand-binding sensor domain-containing protein